MCQFKEQLLFVTILAGASSLSNSRSQKMQGTQKHILLQIAGNDPNTLQDVPQVVYKILTMDFYTRISVSLVIQNRPSDNQANLHLSVFYFIYTEIKFYKSDSSRLVDIHINIIRLCTDLKALILLNQVIKSHSTLFEMEMRLLFVIICFTVVSVLPERYRKQLFVF